MRAARRSGSLGPAPPPAGLKRRDETDATECFAVEVYRLGPHPRFAEPLVLHQPTHPNGRQVLPTGPPVALVLSPAEQALSADLRAKRDQLELEVESLRGKKSSLPEDQYYARLEPLLVQLARLYDRPPQAPGPK